MKLLIDSREKSRIKQAEELCGEKGINCEVIQLTSNDYLFLDGNKTVGFEFKEINDFVSSIANGRIFRQVVESDTDFTFVIISGYRDLSNALFKHNQFSKQKMYSVEGAIARLNLLCDGVWLEASPIFRKCLDKMLVQAGKCFNTKHYSSKMEVRKTGDSAVINYLSSIKGVSNVTALRICGNLNLKTLEDLIKVTKDDLVSIDGIGGKTSDKILEALK